MARNVSFNGADFDLFDQDLSPSDYEFFRKHTGAFKRMLEDQSKSDKLKFIEAFRDFSVSHGCMKGFPSKTKQKGDGNHAFLDESVKYFQDQLITAGKFSSAKNLVLDAVILAQNRHMLQYMDSHSYSKDPFFHKDTRDVFRRLFGHPGEKGTCLKVVCILPLHIKFGGALCRYLKRWLESEDKEREAQTLKQAELKSSSTKSQPLSSAKSTTESTKKASEKKQPDAGSGSSRTTSTKSAKIKDFKDKNKEKEKEKSSGREDEKGCSTTDSKSSDASSVSVMITCPTDKDSKVYPRNTRIFDLGKMEEIFLDDVDTEECGNLSLRDISSRVRKNAVPLGVLQFGKPGDLLSDLSASLASNMKDNSTSVASNKKDDLTVITSHKKDDSTSIVKKLREESKKSSGGAPHVVSSESDAEEWESKIQTSWVDDDSTHSSIDVSLKIESDGSFTKLREDLHLGKPHPNEIYEEQRRKRDEAMAKERRTGGKPGDESRIEMLKEVHKLNMQETRSHRRLHACANCRKVEPNSKTFKKCARCGGRGTRFYCSRECQGEDWVARHRDEHRRREVMKT